MIEQVFILLTSGIAIWLTQQDNAHRARFACVFGLIGQPFWFYSAYQASQWGILMLTLFYSYCWLLGLRKHWFK